MQELGTEPVDLKLIARMYDYYNTHWQEYYGTENVFSPSIMEKLLRSQG
jgi:hypothetical protein